MARTIDLNCDVGESFGAWTAGQDEAVLALVSSANVACGFHAGDPEVMLETVRLCRRHGVALGAHVGLPDLQGFGRREMAVSPGYVHATTLYQVGALSTVARAEGMVLCHVKPHGALYNMAARDERLAEAIARAVALVDPHLRLFGLADSALVDAGRAAGLAVVREAFADRRYEEDGRLTPRSMPGAVIEKPEEAVAQLLGLVERGVLQARGGARLAVQADTVCLHGDRPDAAAFARALRSALDAAGVRVAPPGPAA